MNVYFHADGELLEHLRGLIVMSSIGGGRANSWRRPQGGTAKDYGDYRADPDTTNWLTVGLSPRDWPEVMSSSIRLDPAGAQRAPGAGRPPSWSCRAQATSGHTGRIWARHVDGREATGSYSLYVRVGLINDAPEMAAAVLGGRSRPANGVLDGERRAGRGLVESADLRRESVVVKELDLLDHALFSVRRADVAPRHADKGEGVNPELLAQLHEHRRLISTVELDHLSVLTR